VPRYVSTLNAVSCSATAQTRSTGDIGQVLSQRALSLAGCPGGVKVFRPALGDPCCCDKRL
jgi:hypothetical protein